MCIGWLVSAAVVSVAGCGQLQYRLFNAAPPTRLPNPLPLPAAKDAVLWDAVVDTVDDYFRIAHEQPVHNRDGLVTDGRLETVFQSGPSVFEPWRKDGTAGFERLQGTFQSIRRRAIVTLRPAVAPAPPGVDVGATSFRPVVEGYLLEVVVTKDIEDADRIGPEEATTDLNRHDGTLIRRDDRYDDSPITLGWIPLGRDTLLEQRILFDIQSRLTKPDAGKHGFPR